MNVVRILLHSIINSIRIVANIFYITFFLIFLFLSVLSFPLYITLKILIFLVLVSFLHWSMQFSDSVFDLSAKTVRYMTSLIVPAFFVLIMFQILEFPSETKKTLMILSSHTLHELDARMMHNFTDF